MKIILIISIIIIAALGLMMLNNRQTTTQDVQPTTQPVASSPTTQPKATTALYKNTVSNYSIRVPNDWEITERKNAGTYVQSLTTFTPRATALPYGTFHELTVVAMQEPTDATPLTTQEEFDYWLEAAQDHEKDGYVKLDNATIDGNEAVILSASGTSGWRVMAWLRENDLNYYIDARSKQTAQTEDFQIFDELIASFTFFE